MLITQSFTYQEVSGLKFGYRFIGRPRMFSHVYFVDGLLVDTGHRWVRRSVLSATKELAVRQIFLTHHHEDHTGNIRALKAQHDCPVYASDRCCEMMRNPPGLSLAQWVTWGPRPAQRDILPQRKKIETPRFTFGLIPIPGHAPDMMALYEPNRGWLFSADLYINTHIDYFLADERIDAQITSIKKVLALDFDVLFCGHRPQLKNGKKQLSKKLRFLETFRHDVTVLYERGYPEWEIFGQLQLRENHFVKILSGGSLSKMNMVRSVIHAIREQDGTVAQ